MKLLASLAIAACLALPAAAQDVNESATLHTVGRTITANGRLHDYIVWQPGDAATTFGKSFTVYRKSGPATSTDTYKLLSRQSLQTAPAAILALLKLGSTFDHDAPNLAPPIAALLSSNGRLKSRSA